jgi:peptidoglycan hydrolase CwlO-like protein
MLALIVATSFRLSPITRADDALTPLQQQLKDIERQIAEDKAEIAKTQSEAKTLANTLKTLGKQQSVLQLQIQSTEAVMNDTENRLLDAQIALQENEQKREVLRGHLADVIRSMHTADNRSILLSFISSKNIFDVLDTAEEYQQLTGDLAGAVEKVKETSAMLAEQEEEYTREQEEVARLRALHGVQQVALRASVVEQKTLLTETKGEEAAYQAELADHKAQAALIRNRIYELLDTGNTHITFGEAVKIASWVSGQTGIEPAFLLSVLSQESNLGANVGTCNRVGDPPSKHWKVMMKPTRDQEPFVKIMDELGRSTEGTPISCAMRDKSGAQIGWGGAMGPAQFIPSTWIGYSSKIQNLTGKAADPWDIRDAFVAASLKLMNDGAGGGDEGEWAAAMRYFSGSTNTQFRFYGDQVMTRTEQYRKDIQELES